MSKKDVGKFECKECGVRVYTGKEFSDHVHAVGSVKPCPNPVFWQPTNDWVARNENQ